MWFWNSIARLGEGSLVLGLAGVGGFEAMRGRARNKRNGPVLLSWIGVPVALALTQWLKHWVDRPRPFQVDPALGWVSAEAGKSFPSGHTTAAFALATALAIRWPKGSPVWFGLAIGVGASRIALGTHWPSDVVAGALVGFGIVFSLGWVELKFRASRGG